MKNRFKNILFWSIISAAFIGPGTVTTAAAAGAGFGYSLIWALVFSIITCFVLQEASARITIISGKNLGQVLHQQYGDKVGGKVLVWFCLLAIFLGCLAFEAGNILGATAGVKLLNERIPSSLIVLFIGFTAFIVLLRGSLHQIARLLGIIVALMGLCFIIVALSVLHNFQGIVSGSFIPSIPYGAELIVLGLIGTTVVPYNIFLGSGLRHSQSIREMRISMGTAIVLGGFISIAILLSATVIQGEFTFNALASTLEERFGIFARILLAVGLLGAGFSSALTAALAAAITAQSLLAGTIVSKDWNQSSLKFRMVWGSVLITGITFGLLNLQPVPVIIVAQALNGIILPVIAIVLFILLNDERIIPKDKQPGMVLNYLTGFVVYLTFLAGVTNVLRALSRAQILEIPDFIHVLGLSMLLFLAGIVPVLWRMRIKSKNL